MHVYTTQVEKPEPQAAWRGEEGAQAGVGGERVIFQRAMILGLSILKFKFKKC